MPERLIHLVFKTHLVIGFTDLAAKVRRQYHDRFIPQAIETGEPFFPEDPVGFEQQVGDSFRRGGRAISNAAFTPARERPKWA